LVFKKNSLFNQRGFTLLEVLIAITVLSFIMIGIVSITDSSDQKAKRVITEDLDLLQVETALSRLEWDINHAYSPLYFSHEMKPTGLTPAEGQVYNSILDRYSTNERFAFPSFDAYPVPNNVLESKESFTFFTIGNRRKFKNSKQSHFAWVRYEIGSERDLSETQKLREDEISPERKDAQGGDKILIRKVIADNVFDPSYFEWDDVKSQILLRNIEKIVFEFWNPANRKWTENLSTIQNGQHVIRGVRVTIEWIDYTGIKRTFINIIRPLYPNFQPEDLYKFLYPQNNRTGANGNNGANGGQPQ
tara:strand:+ start:46477 stop:47388 length:912 start_codon:yes stop_codon:yes gene_type:complete